MMSMCGNLKKNTVKDELLLSTTHLLFPDIFCDSTISDFPCENSPRGISTSDHLQNTPDVSLSLHFGEDTSLFGNPFNISFIIFGKEEGEHSCFSSTPLYDSSDNEDVDEHIEFSDRGSLDPFTPLYDHDVDSFVVDISKCYETSSRKR